MSEEMKLSNRVYNALMYAFSTYSGRDFGTEEVATVITTHECRNLLKTKGLGKKGLEEIRQWCRDEGHKMACGCPDHCQRARASTKREVQRRSRILLAIKVINLRRALETANRCLRINGQFAVGCNEDDLPTLQESQKFYAEVRKLDP